MLSSVTLNGTNNTISGTGNYIINAAVADGTSSGGFTKTGANTLTLTGANTYSGGTTITAGKLLVNNTTGSGTGAGAVNVANGATLSGSGIMNPTGTNTVAFASGSNLTPGTGSATNSLTISSAGNTAGAGMVAIGSSMNFTFNLGAGLTSSSLNLTGAFANEVSGLTNSDVFNFVDTTSGALALGDYTLVSSDSTANPFQGLSLGVQSGYTLNGLSAYSGDTVQLAVNQLSGSNDYALQLEITAAPEPGTWALMLIGLLTLIPVARHIRTRSSFPS